MQAITYTEYGAPDVLQLQHIPTPTPEDNQVLIKIHATSVTQVDVAFRSGNPPIARLFTGLFAPKQPILGTELSGEITEVGEGVTRFTPGQRVFAAAPDGGGAHAQYICMSEDAAIVEIPEGVGFEESAVIANGALTALPFLRDTAKLLPDQTILIIGAAGSIGTAAVQFAKRMGAHVTGVCSTANLEMVTTLGADHVIDYTKEDFRQSGRTFDVIFDTVGKSTFGKSRASLSAGGIYLTTVPDIGTLISPLFSFMHGGKRAKMAATGLRPNLDKIKDMKELIALVSSDELTVTIDRSYPLGEIQRAHKYVEAGHKRGNLVITVPHERPAI